MPDGRTYHAAIAAALAVLHLADSKLAASRQARLEKATLIVLKAIERANPAVTSPRLPHEPSDN